MRNFTLCALLIIQLISFGQGKSATDKKAFNLFDQAKSAYDSHQYSKSLSILSELIAVNPQFSDAYLLQSDIYQDMDSINQQINALEKTISINPEKNSKIYYLLGKAYYRTGKYDLAGKAYQNYVSRNEPGNPLVLKANQSIAKCKVASELLNHPVPFQLINLGSTINSDDDEYWPSITVDGKTLIFTRLVSPNKTGKQGPIAQEDFYTSNFVNGGWQPSTPFASIV